GGRRRCAARHAHSARYARKPAPRWLPPACAKRSLAPGRGSQVRPASAGLHLLACREIPSCPVANGGLHLGKMAFEKMIGAFDHDQFLRLWGHLDQSSQAVLRAELIARAAYEKLGLGAIAQEPVGIGATLDRNRRAQRDKPGHSTVAAGGGQSGGGAEGESA